VLLVVVPLFALSFMTLMRSHHSRTIAELTECVGEVDEYLAMPLVKLIYELAMWKKKHSQLSQELEKLKQERRKQA